MKEIKQKSRGSEKIRSFFSGKNFNSLNHYKSIIRKEIMNVLCKILFTGLFLTVSSLYSAEFTATRCESPPKLDGRLNDAVWQKATKIEGFLRQNTEEPAEIKTAAYVLYCDDAIYFGAHCTVPEGEKIRSGKRPGGIGMGKDDIVAFMLDPGGKKIEYFAFYVNADGSVYNETRAQGGFMSNSDWRSDARAKGFKGEGFWSCELRIPYATLDFTTVPGTSWGLNIARIPRYTNEISSIAVKGALHNSNEFAVLKLETDFARYALAVSGTVPKFDRFGCIGVETQITNLDDVERKLIVRGDYRKKNSPPITSQRVTLAPRETKSVLLRSSGSVMNDDYLFRVVIYDSVTNAISKALSVPIKIDYAPLGITMIEPIYRNMIFASQKLAEVKYNVVCNLDNATVITGIRNKSGDVIAKKELKGSADVSFPVEPLPFESMTVFAEARDSSGKLLLDVKQALRRLPYRKGEVWRDKTGVWHRDGKKIFIISEWNIFPLEYTIASPVWGKRKPPEGKFAISFNVAASRFAIPTFSGKTSLSEADEKAIRERIAYDKARDELLFYFLCDEPEGSTKRTSIKVLEQAAEIMKNEDPYHPIMIANFTMRGYKSYIHVGDMNGLHPYPDPSHENPKNNFGMICNFMEQAMALNSKLQSPPSIIYLQQGFNCGDLTGGQCIPSYDEIRTQMLMSLIMGGHGVMFYNRGSQHYPELYIGTHETARELAFYGPILTDENVLSPLMKYDSAAFRWIIRRHKGKLWIFSTSTNAEKQNITMTVPELGDTELQVVGEERSIKVKNGTFTDVFNNFQVHIYTTETEAPPIKPFQKVEEEIEAVYAARRKPGNLAYQRYEGTKLIVSASSNHYAGPRRHPNAALWHVTDGSMEPGSHMTWIDTTPDAAPDWLELKFHKPLKIGRVVVYPLENSLRDYEIQIFRNGTWEAVAKIQNASGEAQTHSFPSVETDSLRIWVTATNGKHVNIVEIEVYE